MLLSQTVTSFIQFNKKKHLYFSKDNYFHYITSKIKNAYFITLFMVNTNYLVSVSDTGHKTQPLLWLHINFISDQGMNTSRRNFFLYGDNYFHFINPKKRKKYGISTQSSKPLCVCVKTNTSFQLQLVTSATFHVQKIFSIFL